MAIMGSLGDIVFSVTPETVSTMSNIVWSISARYGEHKRHMQESLLEFEGNDPDSFSFDMFFSAFLGVEPMTEVKKVLFAKREGKSLPLYIGGKGYGTSYWALTKATIKLKQFDKRGNLVIAAVAVTLRSHGSR